ncbi:hypothetical protein Q9966_008311 [Columba livia]|nr:hypothetical protein Q9966_008311 [Columba livia]
MTWRPPFTPRVVWLNDDSEDEDEEEKEVEAAPASQHEEVQEHQLLQAGQWWAGPQGEWLQPAGTIPVGIPKERGDEGTGLFPTLGSGHAPSTGTPSPILRPERRGSVSPPAPVTGLGCVLQPLPQPLSSAHAWSLPDPSWELPEEEQKQEDTHVLHNPRAKLFWETVHPKDCEGSTVELAEAMTEGQSYDAEAGAALLDMLVESEVSTLKQVPRIVRCIHQWFMTNTDESVEHSLDNTLVELTDAHPHDVVVALLRCAPSCDRFIVLTVKALLCRLGYRLVAFEVERKRGWDTLLHAETHHCAMGLLAREIRVVSRHLNASVASYLVELLSRNEPRCELPAMAFLVEILASPGPNVRAESFLQLVPRYLQSTCSMTRSLLLKGLNVICDTPWMVPKMRFLVQRLTDLLQDADMDMVRMTLSVLRKVVRDPSVPISTPIALQLAERLQPLFDNDQVHLRQLVLSSCPLPVHQESWYVRQLSVSIFKKVIERVANDGKKLLKTLVHQSLLPLIFHVFDENKAVAATCRDTLLQATAFLKKEKLRQVVLRDQQTEAIGECLLVECRSRAAEYLRQTLTYMQSPQDSIREAAVAFLVGLALAWEKKRKRVLVLSNNSCPGMQRGVHQSQPEKSEHCSRRAAHEFDTLAQDFDTTHIGSEVRFGVVLAHCGAVEWSGAWVIQPASRPEPLKLELELLYLSHSISRGLAHTWGVGDLDVNPVLANHEHRGDVLLRYCPSRNPFSPSKVIKPENQQLKPVGCCLGGNALRCKQCIFGSIMDSSELCCGKMSNTVA